MFKVGDVVKIVGRESEYESVRHYHRFKVVRATGRIVEVEYLRGRFLHRKPLLMDYPFYPEEIEHAR